MQLRLVTTFIVGLLFVGCDHFAPEAAVSFDPPASYQVWWQKTEACSGAQGGFARIHWYLVPGDGFVCPGGHCAGRWETNHTIYIAEGWRDHEMVVRHEMLHDLIGHAGHPNPPFGAPCALTWATWAGSRGAIRDNRVDRAPVRID
jgi:hypothetical protein